MATDTPSATYLDQLNDVQRQAVTAINGPVLVVAGPGSGKTRVLTFRIAYLIESGVAPWEVLALTFTNKAAREMKGRIEKVVGQRAGRVWAGTFHSLFARILRVEAAHIGYPTNFTIYDSDDTKSLIGQLIKELNLDKNVYNVNNVRSRISSAKSNLITPISYAANEELVQQDRLANMPLLHEIYKRYTARCKQSGAMDFDDLLYRLYELLQKNEEVLTKYRKKFRYVLVDEFQDTNTLQYAIVRKLVQYKDSPRNICVVGDDAQSIYAFRGATIQNILDFEHDFAKHGIQTFKLEQNYRSTESIVAAANEVIGFNKRQIQKKIWSNKGLGQKIKLIKTMDDTEEGRRVGDQILELKTRHHLSNSDIAILYRTNSQSRIFEEYLRKYNIAYRVYGGLSFYQRKEVKDLVAYLRLVVNPRDEEALRRVINFPKRAIGNTTLDKIATFARQEGVSMWDVLPEIDLPKRTRHSLDGFIDVINSSRERLETNDAFELADYIVKRSGLGDMLRNDSSIEGMGRLENVNALLDGIKSFVEEDTVDENEDIQDKGLATYLSNIALLTDFDNDKDQSTDVVTLMTVHSAKGLEYRAVFVVGLEEKLFPSWMSMDSVEQLDEERRLFYVAITRAEEFLTLSFANSRYRYGKITYGEPSRFISELPLDAVEATHSPRHSGGGNVGMRGRESRSGGGGAEPQRSRVTGGPRGRGRGVQAASVANIDPATFKPSPRDAIVAGATVLHLKFGRGEVKDVSGASDNPVALIVFPEIEQSEKRLALKFAKLQVL